MNVGRGPNGLNVPNAAAGVKTVPPLSNAIMHTNNEIKRKMENSISNYVINAIQIKRIKLR